VTHIICFTYLFSFLRQASEQYFTSSQFLAQAFRHTVLKPHRAQILLGRLLLLPLKEVLVVTEGSLY
jgi:hypothetical protein